MKIVVMNVHKSQMAQIFIGGNCGSCEQLPFVNNEVLGKEGNE
jgi:hypothetical protein